jgi:hypothetical protein
MDVDGQKGLNGRMVTTIDGNGRQLRWMATTTDGDCDNDDDGDRWRLR